jgi:hypothetical protein
MGQTIYGAAFAALYVKLASLDFKLDMLNSPQCQLGALGGPLLSELSRFAALQPSPRTGAISNICA